MPLIKALPFWSKCQFQQEKVHFLDPAPLTPMFKTSSSTDLSTNTTQIIVEYDGVDDGGGCSGDSDKMFAF